MVMEKEQILAQARDMLEQKKYDILTGQVDEFHRLSEIKDTMKLDFSSLEYGLCLNVSQLEDLAENDKKLMNFATRIREEWKYKCLLKTTPFMIAPFWESENSYYTFQGKSVFGTYELLFKPFNFFDSKEIEGYHCFNCLFKSGMSAIYAALLLAIGNYQKSTKVISRIGYYNTLRMMDLLEDTTKIQFIQLENQNYDEVVANEDIFFFECQKATRSFGKLDIALLVESFQKVDFQTPKLLIIDSTFQGNTFSLESLLEPLKNKQLIVINVRSVSKLDQMGLNFCNGGFLEFYYSDVIHNETEVWQKKLEKIASTIFIYPSYTDIFMLDNCISLTEEDQYSKLYSETCKELYNDLSSNHNLCSKLYWEEGAPYINAHIFLNLIYEADLFYNAISVIIKELGGKIFRKSSFGYRYLAFEYYIDAEDNVTTSRISPGVLKGYSYWSFICLWELLQDCRSYDLSLLIK